jgi:hypothetical protein
VHAFCTCVCIDFAKRLIHSLHRTEYNEQYILQMQTLYCVLCIFVIIWICTYTDLCIFVQIFIPYAHM